MKKLLFISVLIASAIFTSCSLDVDGNNAKATTYHYGVVEKYEFSDSVNVAYSKYISEALKRDSIISIPFEHTAEVNVADISYAVSVCDDMANSDYKALLKRKNITLDGIKRAVFSQQHDNDSVFNSLIKDCGNYTDLNLKSFKIAISLLNYNSLNSIYRDTLYVK